MSSKAPQSSIAWFQQARFGMFIHYGLYSLLGRHEWAMCLERIPPREYRRLADRFNPRRLDIRDWAAWAKRTQMRYMCLTTRHCDGFALFDSQASEFNAMRSAARRDLVREFVEACRAAGLGVGFYYSVADWGDAGYVAGPRKNPSAWKRYVEIVYAQLRELMSNYGRIDYLFYDACPPVHTWHPARINAEIRRLQPQILISDRCGLKEDVLSAEQHVIVDPGRPWEACFTTNESWGFNAGDHEWRTPLEVVLILMNVVQNGGNLLLNIGPKADGSFPKPAQRLLRRVGGWVKQNAEAIFGTRPHPFGHTDIGLSAYRGRTAYLALRWNHGPDTVVAGIGNRVRRIQVLANGRNVPFTQKGDRLFLRGLVRPRAGALPIVIAVTLDGKPRVIPHPTHDNERFKL